MNTPCVWPMLKSMTAYGRANVVTPSAQFTVEVQSTNRRYLEVQLYLPREMGRFDAAIRKWVAAQVDRGQVIVRISVKYDATTPFHVTPNLPLVRAYAHAAELIRKEIGAESKLSLNEVMALPGVLVLDEELADESQFENDLKKAFDIAVSLFLEMRISEGKALVEDLHLRIALLEKWNDEVAAMAQSLPDRFAEKLKLRLEEVLTGNVGNEDAVLREIVIYASRLDVTEEIVRLRSHLKQMRELLSNKGRAVGKTLDFLTQELIREVNTIGSKSPDSEIAQKVVLMKSEVEKIREQIQNIE